jgi:hypothetical protein
MATKAERFPKRFLSAADLKGKPLRLQIKDEYGEELTDTKGVKKEKSILSFTGTNKELVLNSTNFDLIQDLTGEIDTDNWKGAVIVLVPDKTQMSGKIVDCIRVRAPDQGTLDLGKKAKGKAKKAKASHDDDNGKPPFDDDIPFKG